MRFRKASRRNIIFGLIFADKTGGLECRKPSWRSVLVGIYDVSAFRGKASKMRGKRHPKMILTSSFVCTGIGFLGFGVSLGVFGF